MFLWIKRQLKKSKIHLSVFEYQRLEINACLGLQKK